MITDVSFLSIPVLPTPTSLPFAVYQRLSYYLFRLSADDLDCVKFLFISEITMYHLQYWNERDAQWRGAGFVGSLPQCRLRMRGARAQCHDCVRFRIHFVPDLIPA